MQDEVIMDCFFYRMYIAYDKLMNINAPIFRVDNNGLVNEWNPCISLLTGYTKEEIYGKHISLYIHEFDNNLMTQIFLSTLNKRSELFHIQIRTKKNECVHLSIQTTMNKSNIICIGKEINTTIPSQSMSSMSSCLSTNRYTLKDDKENQYMSSFTVFRDMYSMTRSVLSYCR